MLLQQNKPDIFNERLAHAIRQSLEHVNKLAPGPERDALRAKLRQIKIAAGISNLLSSIAPPQD